MFTADIAAALGLGAIRAEGIFDLVAPVLFVLFWIVSALVKGKQTTGDEEPGSRPSPQQAPAGDAKQQQMDELRRFLEEVSGQKPKRERPPTPAAPPPVRVVEEAGPPPVPKPPSVRAELKPARTAKRSSVPEHVAASKSHASAAALRALASDREVLRNAVIYHEVLGSPAGLRGPRQ